MAPQVSARVSDDVRTMFKVAASKNHTTIQDVLEASIMEYLIKAGEDPVEIRNAFMQMHLEESGEEVEEKKGKVTPVLMKGSTVRKKNKSNGKESAS